MRPSLFGGLPPDTVVVDLKWPDGTRRSVTLATTTTKHRLGIRRWWVCPNCGRRSGCLYSPHPDKPFACRKCWGLLYASQYESAKIRNHPLMRFLRRWKQGQQREQKGRRHRPSRHAQARELVKDYEIMRDVGIFTDGMVGAVKQGLAEDLSS